MSDKQSESKNFIQELRNRRVFRVAAVYLGSAFALLEAADIVVATYGLPTGVVRVLMILLLIGFPVSIGLAWSFQFTPEGLRRSPRSGEKQSTKEKPLTGNPVIVVLLIVIIVLLAYPRFTGGESGGSNNTFTGELDPKAVAVLPFTNFSASEDDAFFADGIHDDILTQLSKIRDLRVISRTTMSKYKNTDLTMGDIARELGAANILEGSVRRAGDQVRIVAQLIQADSDDHLWAETYDRDYADIFSVQTDVARSIATALQSTLSPEEEQQLAEIPTENMEAYDYYLRGNQYWYTRADKEGNMRAVAMYERAVELDPNFGLAYARLSIAHSVLYQDTDWDPTEERKQQARRSLQKALSLVPDHGETHFAKGVYHEWCENDEDAALEEYKTAYRLRPSHAESAHHVGLILMKRGEWVETRHYLKAAYDLEPDGMNNSATWANMNFVDWNFEEAEKLFRQSIQNYPETAVLYRWLADLKAFGFGDTEAAIKVIEDGRLHGSEPEILLGNLVYTHIIHRDYQHALKLAADLKSNAFRIRTEAFIYFLSENEELSRLKADSSLQYTNEDLKENPKSTWNHIGKAQALAILGDKAAAIAAGELAVANSKDSVEPLFRSNVLLAFAEILVLCGDHDRAVDILLEVLQPPSLVTPWKVQIDPLLDPIKDHPRLKPLLPKMAI
jgi:TolB-like protein